MELQGDILAVLSAVFWSVAVILMRISGYRIPALPLTFFKSAVAVLFFVLTAVVLQARGDLEFFPDLGWPSYLRLIASAVLGISIADVMFVAALNRLGASLQALANCCYSPSVAAVGFLMFGEILGAWEWIGGAMVITGVIVGMKITAEVKSRSDLIWGLVLAILAHVIMAFGILMVRDIIRELSLIWVSGFRFFVATIILGAGAWISGGKSRSELFLGFQRRETWTLMIPMSFFGPFLATICWTGGFKHLPAGRAAIYNQLSTVFIVLLAYLVLREEMTKKKWIGVGLALLGSGLVAANS